MCAMWNKASKILPGPAGNRFFVDKTFSAPTVLMLSSAIEFTVEIAKTEQVHDF